MVHLLVRISRVQGKIQRKYFSYHNEIVGRREDVFRRIERYIPQDLNEGDSIHISIEKELKEIKV